MAEKQPLLRSIQSTPAPAVLGRPLVYSLLAALGPLCFGFTMGFTSPVGDHLKDSTDDGGLGLTDGENSLFGSIVNVGAMLGAMSGGMLADSFGRVGAMRISCLPFIAGFLLVSFAQGFPMLLAGRVLCGVGVGIVSLAFPVYVAEIAPPAYRGALGSINQLSITVGIVVVFALGIPFSWRTLSWIGALLPGALLLITFRLPRTPHWLVAKDRHSDARDSLLALRGEDQTDVVDSELDAIVEAQSAKGNSAVSPRELLHGAAGRAMVVGVCLMLFQQFSGINAVIFYTQSIFEDAGVESANVAALSVSATQVIVTAISCLLVDRAGRRMLLMLAGIGMACSSAILGYYFYMTDHGHSVPGLLAVFTLILYIVFFSLGLGAIPWLMMSEIFPGRIRGLASSAATLLNWSCAFAVTEAFSSMKSGLTEAGVFWLYAGVCVLGVTYVVLGVPETKGRTLEEIERYFNGDSSGMSADTSGAGFVKATAALGLLAVGIVVLTTSL